MRRSKDSSPFKSRLGPVRPRYRSRSGHSKGRRRDRDRGQDLDRRRSPARHPGNSRLVERSAIGKAAAERTADEKRRADEEAKERSRLAQFAEPVERAERKLHTPLQALAEAALQHELVATRERDALASQTRELEHLVAQRDKEFERQKALGREKLGQAERRHEEDQRMMKEQINDLRNELKHLEGTAADCEEQKCREREQREKAQRKHEEVQRMMSEQINDLKNELKHLEGKVADCEEQKCRERVQLLIAKARLKLKAQINKDLKHLEENTADCEDPKCREREQREKAERKLAILTYNMKIEIRRVKRGREEDHRELEDQKNKLERELKHLQKQVDQGPARVAEFRSCPTYTDAEQALTSMQLHEALFNRRWDRCFCHMCYPSQYSSVIHNEGPEPYVVPRGWVRFGLQVPPQAHVHDVFEKWCVSFHGTKGTVAKAILETGDFLMPGDTLPDGSQLSSRNCAGRIDKMNFTSPTINYAGLGFYARPERARNRLMFQVVLQCRQKPGTFRFQSETMRFGSGAHELCPHVKADKVEWVTTTRKSLIPYGILFRMFDEHNPPRIGFRSPVDPTPLYDGDPGI